MGRVLRESPGLCLHRINSSIERSTADSAANEQEFTSQQRHLAGSDRNFFWILNVDAERRSHAKKKRLLRTS